MPLNDQSSQLYFSVVWRCNLVVLCSHTFSLIPLSTFQYTKVHHGVACRATDLLTFSQHLAKCHACSQWQCPELNWRLKHKETNSNLLRLSLLFHPSVYVWFCSLLSTFLCLIMSSYFEVFSLEIISVEGVCMSMSIPSHLSSLFCQDVNSKDNHNYYWIAQRTGTSIWPGRQMFHTTEGIALSHYFHLNWKWLVN